MLTFCCAYFKPEANIYKEGTQGRFLICQKPILDKTVSNVVYIHKKHENYLIYNLRLRPVLIPYSISQ